MNNHLFVSTIFLVLVFLTIYLVHVTFYLKEKKAVTHLRLLYVMIWFWMPFTLLNE